MFNIILNRKDINRAITLANKIKTPVASNSRINTRGVALAIVPMPGSGECGVRLICSDVTHARALGIIVVTDFTMLRAPVETVVLDLDTATLVKAISKEKQVGLLLEDGVLHCTNTERMIVFHATDIQNLLAVPTEVVAWAGLDTGEVRRGILDLIHEGNSLNAAQVEMSVETGVTLRIRSSIAWNVIGLGGGVDYPFSDDGKDKRRQGVIGVGPLAALATIIDGGADDYVEFALMAVGESVRFLRMSYENVVIFASFGRGLS
jgi:hypothetical protein